MFLINPVFSYLKELFNHSVIYLKQLTHPLYKKIVGRTYKLKAHDEENACGVGDIVKVMETRPLSKDKRWRVVEIVEKAK